MAKYTFNKSTWYALLIVAGMLSFSALNAQSLTSGIKIQGSVVDEKDQIIKGAAILIKGSTSGTVTDMEGNFTLTVPSNQSVLVVTFIDFQTQEVKVGEDTQFKIRLETDKKNLQSEKVINRAEGYKVYDQVDLIPKPLSEQGWNQYLAKNIIYPESARKSGIDGTVILGFEVNEKGSIQNVEVIRGIGGGCDQEAVRVVADGPEWTPGFIYQRPVTTKLSMAIRFVLAGDPGASSPKQQNEKLIADPYGKHLLVVGYVPASN
jgi:TonB family protein